MCVCVCACDQWDRAKLPSSSSPPSVVGSLSGCFGLLEAFHTQTHEPARQFSLLGCEPVFPVKSDSSKSSVQWEHEREDSYQEHFTRKWLKWWFNCHYLDLLEDPFGNQEIQLIPSDVCLKAPVSSHTAATWPSGIWGPFIARVCSLVFYRLYHFCFISVGKAASLPHWKVALYSCVAASL